MRLPKFLRFLEPQQPSQPERDKLGVAGHITVERRAGSGPSEVVVDQKNFIVDGGLTGVRDLLAGVNGGGFAGSIFRMAIGDGGVPAGELFNPKLPDSTWPTRTELYHEVLRHDISVFSTPTDTSIRFVGSFNSSVIDDTSYDLADRVINEASLIIGDGILTIGGDPKQVNKDTPDVVDADELMFSTRTFKSVSFDSLEDVTVTITWTITIKS